MKKRNILAKRERELEGVFMRHGSEDEIAKIVEKVRAAQLGVLKCLHYEIAPARTEDDQDEPLQRRLRNIEDRQSWWERAAVDEILQHYFPEYPEIPPVIDLVEFAKLACEREDQKWAEKELNREEG